MYQFGSGNVAARERHEPVSSRGDSPAAGLCADPLCRAHADWTLPRGATSRNPDCDLSLCEAHLEQFLARLHDFDGHFPAHMAAKDARPVDASGDDLAEARRALREVLDLLDRSVKGDRSES